MSLPWVRRAAASVLALQALYLLVVEYVVAQLGSVGAEVDHPEGPTAAGIVWSAASVCVIILIMGGAVLLWFDSARRRIPSVIGAGWLLLLGATQAAIAVYSAFFAPADAPVRGGAFIVCSVLAAVSFANSRGAGRVTA
ncbi:hypothetical protein [Streptomyces sp. NPDC002176]|uniref:hypothetical protein n=1 Tax=Streptomyces sp. NPDC002176 TaxID=3364634 RepID=UPI00384D12A4